MLSIGAVLVAAAGLAYVGVASYLADRDLVQDKRDENLRIARDVAGRVEAESLRTLDAVAALFGERGATISGEELQRFRRDYPLAAQPFRIGPDGRPRYGLAHPFGSERAEDESRLFARASRQCPETGFDACMRAKQAGQRRARRLESARERELVGCRESRPDCALTARERTAARRAYEPLVDSDDTGPDALLGLARLALADGRPAQAVAHFQTLSDRFGDRLDPEGISYALIAQLGIAHASGGTDDYLSVYRAVMARQHRAPAPALVAIAGVLRAELAARELDPNEQAEVAALDRVLADANTYARSARELAVDAEALGQTAGPEPRGRPALSGDARTLVYRREPDGTVVGYVVDAEALEAAAARAEVPAKWRTARRIVQALGAAEPLGVRTLATAQFGGGVFSHLQLAMVVDLDTPDPIDEIVEARGRRHVLLTGSLVGLLIVGLVATVRSATRERELARLKSDFVSTVSHELKTPLTSIRMFAEMLQEGVAGGDADREARYHAIIVKESERLGLLIANVLDYSQIERGTRRYSARPEPLAEVAGEAVETFQRLREGDRYEVRFDVHADAAAAFVRVDRQVVVQSLLNLLANAAKYGGADHPIEVRVYRAGDRELAVSVRDRGPGIPRAEHARIFREFYRAPEAYSSGVEGTGLGLALVKRHVDALGGRVELDSAVGEGSTFALVFPEVKA